MGKLRVLGFVKHSYEVTRKYWRFQSSTVRYIIFPFLQFKQLSESYIH